MPEALNIFTGTDPVLPHLSLSALLFCPKTWQKDPKIQSCILMLFHSSVLQYTGSEQYATTGIYMDQMGPWSMKKFFQTVPCRKWVFSIVWGI